jgi:hypothetical protein
MKFPSIKSVVEYLLESKLLKWIEIKYLNV